VLFFFSFCLDPTSSLSFLFDFLNSIDIPHHYSSQRNKVIKESHHHVIIKTGCVQAPRKGSKLSAFRKHGAPAESSTALQVPGMRQIDVGLVIRNLEQEVKNFVESRLCWIMNLPLVEIRTQTWIGLLRIAIFEMHITIGEAMANQVKVLLVFFGLL
jgi:hypothetical protein